METPAAVEIKRLLIGVVPPTVELKMIFPAPADKVRLKFPSTVLDKVMVPPPALLFKVEGLPRVIGAWKEMPPVIVVIVPARKNGPVPSCVKEPSIAALPPVDPSTVPVLVMEKEPPPVTVKLPVLIKLLPDRVMPAAPLVLLLPVCVIVPVPLIRLIDWVVKSRTLIFWADEITKAPMRVTAPAF